MAPRMTLLSAAMKCCDNTMEMGSTNFQSKSCSSVASALLCACYFTLKYKYATATIIYHAGERNILANDIYQCWYLSGAHLLCHSNVAQPQNHS